MTGFYEDDEPVEKVTAAFERGDKGVTRPPRRGVNERVTLPGAPILTTTSSHPCTSVRDQEGLMAIDRKYGHVELERGDIADDEPVMVFRAQDMLLSHVLGAYWALSLIAGSPQKHLDGIAAAKREIEVWQADHYTKIPGAPR